MGSRSLASSAASASTPKIDFEHREVVECHSTSSIFRGYSIFMKGKDPRDAHFITSRICGICGDNHATCSGYCQNMAYGVQPPNVAEWIVNLGEAAEYMFDHNIFQENLVRIDSARRWSPRPTPAWPRDGQSDRIAACGRARVTARSPTSCGALNPFTGEFYREALQVSRLHPRDVLPHGRPARPSRPPSIPAASAPRPPSS